MAGIEMYERWTGTSRPVKLGVTLKPRDFGYALCRHYTAIQSFDQAALVAAGHKMLRAHLQARWLGSCQYIRAATWLKTVHHQLGREVDPRQCILRAYGDMPGVARLDFV
ncbi:hypothetical protein ABIC65_002306 [Sphingomonas trueperi]|uniref:hypothetical protein n=1 Tax=Sphingomonas trueperi TaxID=53317 RepID=UPI0033942DD6